MYGNQHGRPVGVKIPEGQLTEKTDKPDLSVLNLSSLELAAGEYVEAGKKKMALFLKAGGTWYLAPNGADWLAGCRMVSDKLTANLEEFSKMRAGIAPEDLPTQDAVDIVGAAVAASSEPEVDVPPPTGIEAGIGMPGTGG